MSDVRSLLMAEYRPEPHPLKDLFHRHCIGQQLLAQILDMSQANVCSALNGWKRFPTRCKPILEDLKFKLLKAEETMGNETANEKEVCN